MENDKENIKRSKPITKIPIPVNPLPALPKHLLCEINAGKRESVRCPLRTLSQFNSNVACSSSNQVQKCHETLITKKMRITNNDSRNVTTRLKKDAHSACILHDSTIITISDDSDAESKNVKIAEDKHQNCICESCLVVTPVIQSVGHKAVRKIKKSLMRPHSRELQGLSPVVKENKKVDEKVKRRLMFSEKTQESLHSQNYCIDPYMKCMCRDYTDDMFEYLLAVEEKPLNIPKSTNMMRACAINWLMRVNGTKCNPAIIQTACWFLDSFLGITCVPREKLQVVTAACYRIAQKLHGPVNSAVSLVKFSGNAFNLEQLVAAETSIWRELKFPKQPVVPQEFISYLSWWCDASDPSTIEKAATFLCVSGLMVDKTICNTFPSTIAAAAVRDAVEFLGKKELLIHLQLCPVYKAAEEKASGLIFASFILRQAVRTMSSTEYYYNSPIDHYGATACIIIDAVNSSC